MCYSSFIVGRVVGLEDLCPPAAFPVLFDADIIEPLVDLRHVEESVRAITLPDPGPRMRSPGFDVLLLSVAPRDLHSTT
jgi:hypothetical protein